jgi:hypothetical protein
MARKAHDQRDRAIEAIRRLCNEHGVKEGCRLAREQFPEIPKPTWGRWRVEAIGYQPEQEARDSATRARVAHEVRETIPPIGELVPDTADVIPAQRRAIDFWRLIEELDQDAALMRAYAVTVQPDGTRKLRVPMALVSAHKMRADLIRLALEHASIAWSAERNREFQECIIAAIGEVDRGLQKVVLDRLRRMRDHNEAKYGL